MCPRPECLNSKSVIQIDLWGPQLGQTLAEYRGCPLNPQARTLNPTDCQAPSDFNVQAGRIRVDGPYTNQECREGVGSLGSRVQSSGLRVEGSGNGARGLGFWGVEGFELFYLDGRKAAGASCKRFP